MDDGKGGSSVPSNDRRASIRGELVSEPSAELTGMLRDRFRRASALYLFPGIALLVIGALLWFVAGMAWYVYIPFIACGAFLVFMGVMILSIYLGVPRLQVFEGGVMVKAGRGGGRYHPWSDFSDYRVSTFEGMEVVELHLPKGDGEPISIIERVPEYTRVKGLVEQNVPKTDAKDGDGA